MFYISSSFCQDDLAFVLYLFISFSSAEMDFQQTRKKEELVISEVIYDNFLKPSQMPCQRSISTSPHQGTCKGTTQLVASMNPKVNPKDEISINTTSVNTVSWSVSKEIIHQKRQHNMLTCSKLTTFPRYPCL